MNGIINLYKPLSLTPLQAINCFKQQFPEYNQTKISYAGRLDPLAEGVLLLLVGDRNKERQQFEKKEKEYLFETLVGVETDTYDLLGIPNLKPITTYSESKINKQLLTIFIGKQLQKYPPYSSYRINGKPLFYYARENCLAEIKIPQHEITIYSLELINQKTITTPQLLKQITDKVSLVSGNFRQKEIIEGWQKLAEVDTKTWSIYTLKLSCSSGTYVRRLTQDMGRLLHMPTVTFSILRTKVGEYESEKSLRLTSSQF